MSGNFAFIDTGLSCPSCGTGLQVQFRFSKSVVCPSCGQTNYLNPNQQLDPRGAKQIPLVDYGSVFRLGAAGQVQQRNFRVMGRVRFEYPYGFWDEWLVKMADDPEKEYWIQEDDGELVWFSFVEAPANLTPWEEWRPGHRVDFGDGQVFVTEKARCTVVGAEGELPFFVLPGDVMRFADAIWRGKKLSVEFFEDGSVDVCAGEAVALSQITLA